MRLSARYARYANTRRDAPSSESCSDELVDKTAAWPARGRGCTVLFSNATWRQAMPTARRTA
jgi:hypothetical protein